ncbi:MAG: putative peptidoglycan glycosyltransferase FtsW [Alphaproteobacteria bacterium]
MTTLPRTDRSLLGRWWWTVDRWTLAALLVLFAAGAVLAMAASPAVAERIGIDSFHFVRRQFAFLPLALALFLATSLLSPVGVRRLGAVGFLVALLLLMVMPLLGEEVKGARRWVTLFGFSLQASEFVKPTFAVLAAWLFATARLKPAFRGELICVGLYGLVVVLLLLQPDVGMAVMVSAVWFAQFFVAGVSLTWATLLAVVGLGGAVAVYWLMPHVTDRIDRYLDPASGDSYQVDRALEAFSNGGLFGRGPGEGVVKEVLPDAHSDFVFAVAGEEFGLLACLAILGLFAFIMLRGFARAFQEKDLFALLAVTGLLVQFGLQAILNMAVSLGLLPATGMTLPFISYGGSSLLATALGMGMVLALMRRRPEVQGLPWAV